jgi:conjugative transfer signal peptidase TraF
MTGAANRSVWVCLAVSLAALGGLAGFARVAPSVALINESPSLPRGLYVRQPQADVTRGRIVAVPQPAPARPYLASLGMPGEVALIKRVAAVGGDRVCVAGGRVWTPDGDRPVRRRDRRGAALPTWEECRRLAAHEIFLLGDTAGSFDSRYFGPVDRAVVIGAYREMVTW